MDSPEHWSIEWHIHMADTMMHLNQAGSASAHALIALAKIASRDDSPKT